MTKTGVNIVPIVNTYEFGATGDRWAKGWFTDLDVSGVFTLGGAVGVGGINFPDDIAAEFGTSTDASLLYETADANANELLLSLPAGDATNVPVFAIGDNTALNLDLGLFNGITDPSIAILSNDATRAFRLSHNGTSSVLTSSSDGFQFNAATLTSGGTNDFGVQIAQTLNDAGAAGGTDIYRALYANITTTNITGWNNVYLLDLVDDTVSRFNMLSDGRVTHTIAALVGGQIGYTANFTTSGSVATQLNGFVANLIAGYTGNQLTSVFSATNNTAGISTAYQSDAPGGQYGFRPNGNRGLNAYSTGTTVGTNIGGLYLANRGDINFGVWAGSTSRKNNAANVGVYATGFNDGTTPVQIGGFFHLYDGNATPPTLGNSAALIADNGSTTSAIFDVRDNAVSTFRIIDGGGFVYEYTDAPAGDYTLTLGDRMIYLDNSGGNINLNLPAIAGVPNGFIVWVKDEICTDANQITIDPSGAETIDGAATYVMPAANQCAALSLQKTSTGWFIF